MTTPEEQPKLDDYWQAFSKTARLALRESMGEPLFDLLSEHLDKALQTSFYCGSEAIISALINHQENVGPDITQRFNDLADESAAFLSQNHRQPEGEPDEQA